MTNIDQHIRDGDRESLSESANQLTAIELADWMSHQGLEEQVLVFETLNS